MSNTKSNSFFNSSSLNDTRQLNATRNLKYFFDSNGTHDTSVIRKSNFGGIFPSQTSSQTNQLFKIPSLDNIPVKKGNVKKVRSPSIRVQTGRVKNDLKASQSKLSQIPRPSFINSSKSLRCSRSMQLNARKELIKKMVFLAECTLKENQQANKSTPVKVLAGLTPKKTPRSGGYLMLPEFKKKVPKLEDIKSPIEELIKKEMFSYSAKSLAERTPSKLCPSTTCDSVLGSKDEVNIQSVQETKMILNKLLCQFKLYSKEMTIIHEKIKHLDEAFEYKLSQIPEYKVYNEFCAYQLKKEGLYQDLKIIDEEFKKSVMTKMNLSNKLKTFVKKREELLQREISFLKDLEEVVQSALEKYDKMETKIDSIEKKENEENEETPKLRRSLRLSKISKNNEKTPITKKLKKLDSKSRGIRKGGRL